MGLAEVDHPNWQKLPRYPRAPSLERDAGWRLSPQATPRCYALIQRLGHALEAILLSLHPGAAVPIAEHGAAGQRSSALWRVGTVS